jgi:prefoldin subunit 5
MLSEQAELLEAEMDGIQRRLKELRKPGKEGKNAKQT